MQPGEHRWCEVEPEPRRRLQLGQRKTFILIDNDDLDAITGEFAGLPDGATVTTGQTNFVIDYQGGDGNDLLLMVNQ